MNIREAIKSGKRFRRKPGNMWDPNFWYDALSEADIANRLCRPMWAYEDLVADDWEVEEKQVTITESDFESAINRASQSFSMYNPPHICEYLARLKKELGL